MRRLIIALSITGIFTSSFAITKAEAEKKIQQYFGDTKDYTISVCESKNYFIGEVYLKGYEGISNIRKIYVKKDNGDIIAQMSEVFDFCYMNK
ncbi:MAG: hypothetical protein N2Z80_05300 [Hydrogenothermaceae bacterium]|nr:hypothetical protein [Hydrogenothermaceae bacterium]